MHLPEYDFPDSEIILAQLQEDGYITIQPSDPSYDLPGGKIVLTEKGLNYKDFQDAIERRNPISSIENQTSVMEEQTRVIQEGHDSLKSEVSGIHLEVIRLNQEVSDLRLQLKKQKEESDAALKKEHRFTILCSLVTGIAATVFGTLIATFVINTFF